MGTVIVRYGELALKSEPVRRKLEEALLRSIGLSLGKRRYLVRRERGRIFIECGRADEVARKVAMLPGVTSTSPAISTSSGMEDIIEAVVRVARRTLRPGKSFAIRATRAGEHPFTSVDVCKNAGRAVLEKIPGTRVDLSSPDVEINVEVRGKSSYVYTKVIPGTGGLPIGSQGKIIALMRGQIRDAVAAYLMMKRGAVVVPLFIKRGRKSDGEILKRVKAQVEKLRGLDPDLKLAVRGVARGEDLAGTIEHLARRLKARAIVTGETLKDARWMEPKELLILRPVAGLEGEIRRLARRVFSGPHH